jgi:hypothetical protein
MSNGGGGILEAFKAILQSPVGGWVMACVIVAAMAWITFKDRETLYKEIIQLRSELRPLVQEDHQMLKDILQLLKEKQ